ncbi:unnamed protein product, partial [Meganyctiphanes norvegica]
SVLLKIIKMKVVLAVLLLVAATSAAPWGVLNAGVLPYSAGVLPYGGILPYNAGVLPYAATHAVAPTVTKVANIDGGWPYTDAEGFSTGLTNVGARVPLTYGAYSPYHVATTW